MGAVKVHLYTEPGSTSPDLDGFLVSLDNEDHKPIDTAAVFTDVESGDHTVRIEDVAPQCFVDKNPRQVSVVDGVMSHTVFDVNCGDGYHQMLSFNKLGLGLIVQESDVIEVVSQDDQGEAADFTITPSDPAVIDVELIGDDAIRVTGLSLGQATITVTNAPGVTRTIHVSVYDHMVLPVNDGELLLSYADTFESRGAIGRPPAVNYDGTNDWDPVLLGYTQFVHPVTDDGWYALGTLGVGPFVTYPGRDVESLGSHQYPSVDSIQKVQWMLLVKDGSGNALSAPTDFTLEYKGCGSVLNGSTWSTECSGFWTPVCEPGYVALGTVVTEAEAINPATQTREAIDPPTPSTDDVRCVREDLTAPGTTAIGYSAYARYAFDVDPRGIAPINGDPTGRGQLDYDPYVANLALADDEFAIGDGTDAIGRTPGTYWDAPGETGIGSFRAWRVTTAHSDVFSDRAHLETGTFVGIGVDGGACTDEVSQVSELGIGLGEWILEADFHDLKVARENPRGCYNPDIAAGRARVLAVTLPLVLDIDEWAAPRLNAYEPFQVPEPAQTKVMRVPFTAVWGGETVHALTPAMLETSPFLRLEKSITYKPVAYMYCGGELDCAPPGGLSVAVSQTFGTTNHESFSDKFGVSISSTVGISYGSGSEAGMGWSASITTTFSYDKTFTRGWSQQQLESTTITANKPCPANHACQAWTGRTFLVVHRRLADGSLARFVAGELSFDLGAPIYFDDYP